jgi:endonuclease/exonuclease/phosphatase family metal-dependent hydrolase
MAFAACCLCGSAIAAEPLRVKAMTFNIRCDEEKDGKNRWTPRHEWAPDLIRRTDCDFVGIQEAMPHQRTDLDRALQPEYQGIGVPRGPDGEAVPLYFRTARWKLDASQTGTFWLSDTPDQVASTTWGNRAPRVVTWGRFVEQPSGRAIYVFNTHFDHRSENARQKSAAMLLERIARLPQSEPAILLGDLNSNEDAVAVNVLTGKTPGPISLCDTFRAVHPDLPKEAVGTFHGFSGVPTEEGKIDFIFASKSAKVLSADILREHYLNFESEERSNDVIRENHGERYPSDHFPVSAEIAFP